MSRQIVGLEWARPISAIRVQGPAVGVKAKGLRYEGAVARALPGCVRGQWWAFCDVNGEGFCQTDILTVVRGHNMIVECKLTACEEGWKQLEQLYRPVVEHWLGERVATAQVAKQLDPRRFVDSGAFDALIPTLDVAVGRLEARNLVHWLGAHTALGTRLGKWTAPLLQ